MKKSQEAVEFTSFHLKSKWTLKDFVSANQEVDRWLKKRSGFLSRRMFQDADGRVYDVLTWATPAEGKASTAALLIEFRDSPIHDMIDQRTVEWFVVPIEHKVLI